MIPDADAEQRERRDAFVAAGMRDELAEYVSRAPPMRWLARSLGVLQFALMGGGGVLLVLAFAPVEAEALRRALAAAQASGALLAQPSGCFSLLVFFFAGILASAVVPGLIPFACSRETRAALAAKNVLDSLRHPAAAAYTRRALREIPAHLWPEQAVDALLGGWLRAFAVGAVGLLAIGVLSLQRELDAYTLFAPNAVLDSPYLPWRSPAPRPYADATHVELGCNHVSGKNAGDFLVYSVHFADGPSFDLDAARPVEGSWLDQAERIDAALQRAGVAFVRWRWLNRDPLHPRCLAAQYTGRGPNRRERVDRLLRVDGAGLTAE